MTYIVCSVACSLHVDIDLIKKKCLCNILSEKKNDKTLSPLFIKCKIVIRLFYIYSK